MRPAHSFIVVTILAALAGPNGARADVLIKVNKASQRLTVAVDGVQQYNWPVSTARAGYVTPNGEYRPVRLDRTWFSRKYYNSPMPYSIFFHGGYAIHGSYERAEIGRPASHGCVRLDPKNAEVLFTLVTTRGPENTRILIDGPGASRPPDALSKKAQYLSKIGAERRQQTPLHSEGLADRSRPAVYVRLPSPARSSSEGASRLVDPFSELISYVENHSD